MQCTPPSFSFRTNLPHSFFTFLIHYGRGEVSSNIIRLFNMEMYFFQLNKAGHLYFQLSRSNCRVLFAHSLLHGFWDERGQIRSKETYELQMPQASYKLYFLYASIDPLPQHCRYKRMRRFYCTFQSRFKKFPSLLVMCYHQISPESYRSPSFCLLGN